MTLDLARLFLFPALLAFAAASDLFTMTISNRVSLLLVGGFFVLAWFSGMPPSEMALHVACGFAVLVPTFACFAFGWMGGGDAKIAAAVSLWLGFELMPEFLIYSSVFGGMLTLAILQFRKMPLPYALGSQDWVQRLHHQKTGIPYGIALALGALLVYPDSQWIKAVDAVRFLGH